MSHKSTYWRASVGNGHQKFIENLWKHFRNALVGAYVKLLKDTAKTLFVKNMRLVTDTVKLKWPLEYSVSGVPLTMALQEKAFVIMIWDVEKCSLNYDNKQLTVYDISLLKQISIFKE